MKNLAIILISFILMISNYAQENIIVDLDANYNSSGSINNSMRLPTGIVQGGKNITASGILKIPIVFVRFADDNATTSHWPTADELPSWAENFVDSQVPSNGVFNYNNLTKFYDLSSGGNCNGTLGAFHVVGDVYFIDLPNNRSYYSNDGAVSIAALNILDDPSGPFNVDFRKYDNWEFKVGGKYYDHDYRPFNPVSGVSADNKLDFMLIYWKAKSKSMNSDVGGVASLGVGYSTQTKDGISISSSMGVLGFKAETFGIEHTIWITAHEIGHHQFGITGFNTGSHFNGRADRYGNIQRFGLMTRSEGHQFSAYERYRLGWLDPIVVSGNSSSTILNETHKSNTNNAVIIPLLYDASGRMTEYFLLENYHSTNAYSSANPFLTKSLFNHTISKGIIVYHIVDEDFDWPTLSKVDIESAEGLFNWDVIEGTSTPSNRLDDLIATSTPNVINGFDERDTITAIAGATTYRDYYALTPGSTTDINEQKKRRYDSDDWLGDQEDLFSPEYNSVFNRYSNPSIHQNDGTANYKGFEILSYNSYYHRYTLRIGVNNSGILAMAPSKPQNLEVTKVGNNAVVTWNLNMETDMSSGGKYKVYRAVTTGGEPTSWSNVATVNHPTTSWTDPDYYFTGSGNRKAFYCVSAVDNTNKESLKSHNDWLIFDNTLQKGNLDNLDENKILDYELSANYPNPFNPETTINFAVKEPGFVSLKVYDILGKEVASLVNERMETGNYNRIFNSSNLPSGIYIYTLRVNNFSSFKKMTVLK